MASRAQMDALLEAETAQVEALFRKLYGVMCSKVILRCEMRQSGRATEFRLDAFTAEKRHFSLPASPVVHYEFILKISPHQSDALLMHGDYSVFTRTGSDPLSRKLDEWKRGEWPGFTSEELFCCLDVSQGQVLRAASPRLQTPYALALSRIEMLLSRIAKKQHDAESPDPSLESDRALLQIANERISAFIAKQYSEMRANL